MIKQEHGENPGTRLKPILKAIGIAPSTWYAKEDPPAHAKRRGPPKRDLDPDLRRAVVAYATRYPAARERMASYMVPRFIEFIDALPKTATEKIENYKLKQDALSRRATLWDREREGIAVRR